MCLELRDYLRKNIFKERIIYNKYTESWSKRKLSDIAVKVILKNKTNENNNVLTNSAKNGIVRQSDFFDKKIANKENINGYYIVKENDFIYNPRISDYAPVGPININHKGEGIISPLYFAFSIKNQENDFYSEYFKSDVWHKYLKLISNTGARSDRLAIKDKDFMNMPVKVPNINNQIFLANLFEKINFYIHEKNAKHKNLKQLKKYLMENMFI